MIWIDYILKAVFIGWTIYLCFYDIRIKKVPLSGLIIAIVISILGAINRIICMNMDHGAELSIEATQNTIWLKGLIGIGLGMLPGVFLIILSFATKKVGPADGILMCCIGMFENYLSCVVIFCAASFIMAIISILLLVIKKVKRNSQLPFIPFIALAYVLKIVVAFI